jgi:hypothetical protein
LKKLWSGFQMLCRPFCIPKLDELVRFSSAKNKMAAKSIQKPEKKSVQFVTI